MPRIIVSRNYGWPSNASAVGASSYEEIFEGYGDLTICSPGRAIECINKVKEVGERPYGLVFFELDPRSNDYLRSGARAFIKYVCNRIPEHTRLLVALPPTFYEEERTRALLADYAAFAVLTPCKREVLTAAIGAMLRSRQGHGHLGCTIPNPPRRLCKSLVELVNSDPHSPDKPISNLKPNRTQYYRGGETLFKLQREEMFSTKEEKLLVTSRSPKNFQDVWPSIVQQQATAVSQGTPFEIYLGVAHVTP